MKMQVLPFLALMALASCGGPAVVSDGDSGGSTGGGSSTDTTAVPDSLKVNLEGVAFDGTTLKVKINSLDSTPLLVTYDREPSLDVAGYKAYKMQEDSLDRVFVALAATSADGAVTAVTAGDGGQFNRFFAGGLYSRKGSFSRPAIGDGPAAGQVSYAGNYTAVTNIGAARGVTPTDVALPVDSSVHESLVPQQPSRVVGEIFLNANFADNSVNGSIYNRQLLDQDPNGDWADDDPTDHIYSLPDVALVATSIEDDGTFAGTAEFDGQPDTAIGNYGGIFGGTSAQSVAGAVHLTNMTDLLENEQEHGIFVLTQCGMGNSSSVCDHVAP